MGAPELNASLSSAPPPEPANPTTPSPDPTPGAVARTVAWSRLRTERALTWAVAARASHRSVDAGFLAADRDKRVAAGVLAGGVAYRFFFWMLAMSLLSNGALGFIDAIDVQ